MHRTVDARGLACPQPVILTRRALAWGDAVTAIVDNETARHNVTRMAERAGFAVASERLEDGIYLRIARPSDATPVIEAVPEAVPAGAPVDGPVVLLVAGDTLGRGDAELAQVLVRAFFHTLCEVAPRPDAIIFINNGVKLAVEGSPALADLQALAAAGVEVLACGTCLSYYELTERLAVGEVSNMYTIAETLLQAGKVVSL